MRFGKYLLILIGVAHFAMAYSQNKVDLRQTDTLLIKHVSVENNAERAVFINNTPKCKGDRFLESDKIDWTKSKCVNYVEVINLRTGEEIQKRSPSFIEKANNYNSYIKSPRLGTKGGDRDVEVKDMKQFLSNRFYIYDDAIFIWSSLIIDYNHVYVLTPVNIDSGTSFRLMCNEDEPHLMYIPISQLLKNNIDLNDGPCVFRVNYLEKGEDTFITDKFSIELK